MATGESSRPTAEIVGGILYGYIDWMAYCKNSVLCVLC